MGMSRFARRPLTAMLALSAVLSGCASWTQPATQGDPSNAVSYGYQPLDPFPIKIIADPAGKKPAPSDVLDALPDETMRMAIGKLDVNGNISYGPTSISAANSKYVVTIDYVKSNTIPMFVKKSPGSKPNMFTVATVAKGADANMSVPIYVGVGVRLTANLTTTQAGINLGNLIAIGAAAQANALTGTIVIQTLGLSGENISTALPIPNDVSVASIQSAIQALGTMKAKLYDTSKTTIQPRVVGVYNNLGGGSETINGFISSVLENPPPLTVPIQAKQ